MSAYQAPHDPTDVGLKRMVSAVIDVGIAQIIYFALFAVLSKPNVVVFSSFDSTNACGGAGFCNTIGSRHISGGTATLVWLIYWAYMVGVFILQRGLTGKTLGTMAMGIVTVNAQGRPLGIGYALLRSIAGIVDYIPCCLPLVGIITIFTTKGHRRVGDMAGQSFVVEKAYAGQPVVVPGVTGAAAAGPYAQPYGTQPYGAPGASPYPPQPQYPGQPQAPYPPQPQYPGQPQAPYPPQPGYAAPPQPQYPAQPQYETPAPSGPGTGWPAAPSPAPEAPVTPDDGSGWGAPGATDAPPATPAPEPAPEPVAEPAVETPPATPDVTPPAAAPETVEPQVAESPPAEPQPAEPQPAEPQPAEPQAAPVQAEPAAATPGPEAAADPTQPQWDPARNAYIQWDPDGQRWMQYDDATQQWRAIS